MLKKNNKKNWTIFFVSKTIASEKIALNFLY